MRVSGEELIGRYAALDIINEKNGEIYVEAGQEITQAVLDLFDEHGIDVLPTLAIDHTNVGPYIRNTLAADKNSNREEALLDIYRVMRPGRAADAGAGRDPVPAACCSTSTATTSRRSAA